MIHYKRSRPVLPLDVIDSLKETVPELLKQGMNEALSEFRLKQGEKKILHDFKASFKCAICHSISTPQVVVSMCCYSILGCKACVDRWYEESDLCPKCRVNQNESLPHISRKRFDDALLGVSRLNE